MKNTSFRFKQFSVGHDKCAMKVNTDGVLLGAWAEASDAQTILDIGTGTGVIALMMAQRNSEAIIDAIDIAEHAYIQAKENFEQSSWRGRLKVFHSPLQKFSAGREYDVIVSNPPYFIDDFKTENHQKNIAKHSIALSYEELLSGVNRLLSEKGKGFLAIPLFHYSLIESIAMDQDLFVDRTMEVIAQIGKNPYLVLLQLSRKKDIPAKDSITVQTVSGVFTEEYKSLTKDFYLKF